MSLNEVKKELRKTADPEKAEFLKRFFKTKKGEYAAGDVFIGIVVPRTRIVAAQFRHLPLKDLFTLLKSKIHEERLLALFILEWKFNRTDVKSQEYIYKNYLKLAAKHINNWDLVDSSAAQIVGKYLENRPRDILYKLAKSKNLWEKRISIISTLHFIRKNDFNDTLKIAKVLLNDTHDLIHKAVGWMLREMGKKDEKKLVEFLNTHAPVMPRTMLRYAIEKFPDKIRKKYLTMKK